MNFVKKVKCVLHTTLSNCHKLEEWMTFYFFGIINIYIFYQCVWWKMTELRKRKSKKKWRFWKKIGSKTRNLCEVGLHFQPKFFCYYRKQLNHSRIIWIITSGVKCSFSFFRFRYLIFRHFNLFIRTPKELAVLRCFRKRCS